MQYYTSAESEIKISHPQHPFQTVDLVSASTKTSRVSRAMNSFCINSQCLITIQHAGFPCLLPTHICMHEFSLMLISLQATKPASLPATKPVVGILKQRLCNNFYPYTHLETSQELPNMESQGVSMLNTSSTNFTPFLFKFCQSFLPCTEVTANYTRKQNAEHEVHKIV